MAKKVGKKRVKRKAVKVEVKKVVKKEEKTKNLWTIIIVAILVLIFIASIVYYFSGNKLLPSPGTSLNLELDEGSGTTAHDSSGNNNNGAISYQGTDQWTTGISGTAFHGNPSAYSYITIPNSASLNPTSTITISAWVKLTSATNQQMVLYKDNGTAGYSLYFGGGNVDAHIYTSSTNGTARIQHTYTEYVNGWHYIAVTYNGSESDLYIDGNLHAVQGQRGSINKVSKSILIGTISSSSSFLDGKIDKVKIYSSALSKDEINAEYETDRYRLVANYSFDNELEVTHGIVTDSGQYSNNGRSICNGNPCNPDEGGLVGLPRGVSGKALTFGTGLYVDVQNSDSLDLSYFTLEAWVKPDAFTNSPTDDSSVIIDKGETGVNDHRFNYMLSLTHNSSNKNNLECNFRNESAGTGTGYISSVVYALGDSFLGRWSHVACTFEDSSMKLYINGVNVANKSLYSYNLPTTTSSVTYIGAGYEASPSGVLHNFHGSIDSARIYGYALSAQEIAQHYQSERPNIISYYSFDSISGGLVYDNSSYENFAITNATTISGIKDSALSFDGFSSFMTINRSSPVNDITDFTYSLWIKNYTIVSPESIIEKGATAQILKIMPNGNLSSYLTASNSDASVLTSTRVPGSGWHHIAVVYSSTDKQIRIYIDGVLANNEAQSLAGGARNSDSSSNISIGYGSTSHFNGSIDELRIYDKALSADEVLALANVNCGNGVCEADESCLCSDCISVSRCVIPFVTWITNPTNTTYGSSTINFDILGNKTISSCVLSLDDGVTNSTMTSANSTHFTYTKSAMADGSYTTGIWCIDSVNQFSDVQRKSFSIDTTNTFAISVANPSDSDYNTSSIKFSVTGNQPTTSCVFTLTEWNGNNYTMTSVDPNHYEFTNVSIGDGGYTARFKCYNASNSYALTSVNFGIDTSIPVVRLTAPSGGTFTTDNAVSVNYSVKETGILNKCTYIDNGYERNSTADMVKGAVNNTLSYDSFSAMNHLLFVTCVDTAGNSNVSNNITITVNCPSGYTNCNGVCVAGSSCSPDNPGNPGPGGPSCTQNCTNKQCGNISNCGTRCIVQTCGTGKICNSNGTCSACTPSCSGKVCGDNGCGGSCGTCTTGTCSNGQCVTCTPSCDGKVCGDNGCSGSCGSCDSGKTCSDGACVSSSSSSSSGWFWYLIGGLVFLIILVVVIIIIVVTRKNKPKLGSQGSNQPAVRPAAPPFPPAPSRFPGTMSPSFDRT